MYVRVYDKKDHRYFRSMVYCVIDIGYYAKYVVVDPQANCFRLVEYLDKSGKKLTPLVEIIQNHNEEWASYKNAQLLKYKAYCKRHGKETKLEYLFGYPDVCENYAFLTARLEHGSVPVSKHAISFRDLPDRELWNYIETQEDVNALLKAAAGFHDSTLDKVIYEQTYNASKVTAYNASKVTAAFDGHGWYSSIELCFEGVIAVNLRPPMENYSNEIFEASLILKEETILWADWLMDKEDLSCDGSYIKARSLKWRKTG